MNIINDIILLHKENQELKEKADVLQDIINDLRDEIDELENNKIIKKDNHFEEIDETNLKDKQNKDNDKKIRDNIYSLFNNEFLNKKIHKRKHFKRKI